MRQRNKILEVCSTIALNVKEFFVILFQLYTPDPHFLEQGPEVFRPDASVSKGRALSDAERQGQSTARRVEQSATTLPTKKAV